MLYIEVHNKQITIIQHSINILLLALKLFLLWLAIMFSLSTQAQEQLVNVNGNNYHVYLKGFENRKVGTPALILENGHGVGLGNWDTILELLAQIAPVFAYDRAGVEKSDVQYKMPTINQVAENLKSILTTLHISPPYILIGHSLGGVYIQATLVYILTKLMV